MLTPRFSLDQDDSFVTVTIYAPFTNVADTEVFMENEDFRFFSKPYFLRLHLPGPVEENDKASAKYDADTRSFVVKAPKVNKGEFFKGLDMITELLRPPGASKIKSNIETISSSQEEEEEEWYFDQQVPQGDQKDAACTNGYGFAFQHTQVFSKLLEECQEVLDVKCPDELSYRERREKRLELESQAFSPDHYLCDLFEPDDVLQYYLKNESPWGDKDRKNVAFSDQETEKLISLSNKSVEVAKEDKSAVLLGLVDILFAYCYDHRTTDGEHSTESGWTCTKLCASVVCCERYTNLKECVTTCIRRSLCYPLYRNYELALKVCADVKDILSLGSQSVVKALLDLMPLLTESEGRYIFNQLYTEQYTAWVQSVNPSCLKVLAETLPVVVNQIDKDDLGLELEELETAAHMVAEEGIVDGLTAGLQQVSLDQKKANRDSDDSDSDSSSDSSSPGSSSEESSEEEDDDKEKKDLPEGQTQHP